MYKYELHCHTKETSVCGSIKAKEIAEKYIKAGYSGVVVTDHFCDYNFPYWKVTKWSKIVDKFLLGYTELKKYETNDFKVLLGMELRFTESPNDYLVYGFDKKFLYDNKDLFKWGINEFSKVARKNGYFLAQAHPFRKNMKIIKPELLDAIEVNNGNARHDSRNDIASMWADKFNLIKISGSDFHEYEDLARGGIITDKIIDDEKQLVSLLKSKEFELITC